MRSEFDQHVIELLTFLAEIGAQVNQLQNTLQQTKGLSGIASFVESRNYGSLVYLCVCLEADAADDLTLTWWLDVRPEANGWMIEASVLWNGRTTVLEMPPLIVPDFKMVAKQVPIILNKILEAGRQSIISALADRK